MRNWSLSNRERRPPERAAPSPITEVEVGSSEYGNPIPHLYGTLRPMLIPFESIEEASRNFRAMAIPLMELHETIVASRSPSPTFRIRPFMPRVFGADMRPAVRPFEEKKVYHKITNLQRIANLVRTNFTPGSEQSENFLLPPDVPRKRRRVERRRGFVDARDTSPPVASDEPAQDDTYTVDGENGMITFSIVRGISVLQPPEVIHKLVSGPWPERTPHGPARQREKKQRFAKMYGMGLDKQSRS